MIDFWEALGRIVYNEATGQAFAQVAEPLAVKLKPQAEPYQPGKPYYLDIECADYEAVQNFWTSLLNQPYLSLMAAGDLIWIYYFQESQVKIKSLREAVIQAEPKLVNPSPAYFIGLSLIILDKNFRSRVAASDKPEEVLSPGRLDWLSTQEKDNLTCLARNSGFVEAAADFYFKIWDGGCDDLIVCWEGHLHPRGVSYLLKQDYSTSDRGEKTPALVGAP